MINLHAITVRFIGPTNTRGARVKLTSHRFNQSLTVPFDYECRDTIDQATDWLKAQGFNVVAQAEGKDTIILTDTFRPLHAVKP